MQPNENTFCVLTDSPFGKGTIARRDVSSEPQTNVRSGNQKWTSDPSDIWHMTRERAEEIASRLVYNNPRFCRSEKAIKRMTKQLT